MFGQREVTEELMLLSRSRQNISKAYLWVFNKVTNIL